MITKIQVNYSEVSGHSIGASVTTCRQIHSTVAHIDQSSDGNNWDASLQIVLNDAEQLLFMELCEQIESRVSFKVSE